MRRSARLLIGVLTGVTAFLGVFIITGLAFGTFALDVPIVSFFLIAMAVLGGAAGFGVGWVASWWVGRRGKSPWPRALAQVVTFLGLLTMAAVARMQAAVPPRLDGEKLLLAIEIRWPEGRSPEQSSAPEPWWIRLTSPARGAQRTSSTGPLWREDARLEGGAWVVPGAVDLFTS